MSVLSTLKRLMLLVSMAMVISIPLANAAGTSDKDIKVLTSIHPVQLLTAAITEGVTEPERLVPAGASPHSYSLKPSDMRRLTEADIVIRIGSNLEPFLDKPLRVSKANHLDLMEVPGLKLAYFEEDDHEENGHDHGHHYDHDDHGHQGANPHIWLSPNNALLMARAISKKLTDINPENAAQYQANLKQFETQLKNTDSLLQQLLSSQSTAGFFVFHDAWSYLVEHYGLNQIGVFTVSPEQQPGARHLAALRNKLKANPEACIFTEPQFRPVWIARLTDGLQNKVFELDPLATRQKTTQTGYIDYLRNTVKTMKACLSG